MWFKRIFIFILVNLLVVFTISLLTSVLGIHPYLNAYGIDVKALAEFCLLWGMTGSIVSLCISRMMAKWMMGVQVIDPNQIQGDSELNWLVQTIHRLARDAGLAVMPEVGIYDSPELNAFATGPSRSRALVAVSTGLLSRMSHDEVEGVLGHELTHVANGDMVTMTLVQGVVNAFVMFLSRIIAFAIMQAMRGERDDRERAPMGGFAYYGIQMLLEIAFMILGSMVVAAFSRWREFRADRGGAHLAGKQKMIAALEKLKQTYEIVDPGTAPAIQAFQISGHPKGLMGLFASHPPLDLRIEKLREGL